MKYHMIKYAQNCKVAIDKAHNRNSGELYFRPLKVGFKNLDF